MNDPEDTKRVVIKEALLFKGTSFTMEQASKICHEVGDVIGIYLPYDDFDALTTESLDQVQAMIDEARKKYAQGTNKTNA